MRQFLVVLSLSLVGCSQQSVTTAPSQLTNALSAELTQPAPSPFQTDSLFATLRILCGTDVSVDGDVCAIELNEPSSSLTMRLRSDPPPTWPWVAAPEDTSAPLAIVGRFGISLSEVVVGADTLLKSSDHDGDVRVERAVGRKTFCERRVGGYSVPGSKVVVTRTLEGAFSGIFIEWPGLQVATDGRTDQTYDVAEADRVKWGDRFAGDGEVLLSWKGKTSIALEMRRQTIGASGPSFLERHYYANGEEAR